MIFPLLKYSGTVDTSFVVYHMVLRRLIISNSFVPEAVFIRSAASEVNEHGCGVAIGVMVGIGVIVAAGVRVAVGVGVRVGTTRVGHTHVPLCGHAGFTHRDPLPI